MKEHRLALSELAGGIKFPVDEVHKITLLSAKRFRLVGMFFELNKNFLLPIALPGIRRVAETFAENPDGKMLIVGHTDTSGKDAYNLALSLERAEAVSAYLTDDVAAWEKMFKAKEDEKRWGTREVQYMLRMLPQGGDPFYIAEIHGRKDAATEAGIRRFQEENGLKADGIAGPDTCKALIEAYMALDGTSLASGTEVTVHGCGENFPAAETKDGTRSPQDRRAEIFFFDGDIEPPPPGKTSAKGSAEYPKWVAQASETVDLIFGDVDKGFDFDLPVQKKLLLEQGPGPGSEPEPFLVAANDDALVVSLIQQSRENRGKDNAVTTASGDFIPFRMVDKAVRPDIRMDHGFLDDGNGNIDDSKRRESTIADRLSFLKWDAKVTGAELLRPDLFEACRAYRRFQSATGKDLEFDYEDYVLNDKAGKRTVEAVVEDTIAAALELSDTQRKPEFIMQTDSFGAGGKKNQRFPYPGTENWQKAIGAHQLWLEAKVKVEAKDDKRFFTIDLILRAEDRYNFNPGDKDIATGIADQENGVFEVTGLGKEFDSKSTLKRRIEFTAGKDPVPDFRKQPGDRKVSTPR